MITVSELETFDREFYAGKYQYQRYGQALMNAFYHKSEVAAIRSDNILWEAKNRTAALLRARELQIIP